MKSPDSIKSWQLLKVKDEEIPEPDVPPEAIEPDLERLIAWFIKRRHRIAWGHGADEIVVRPRYENDKPGKDLPGGVMAFKDKSLRVLRL